MHYYKALYDFQAADAVELSVRKGSYLKDTVPYEQAEGWTRVHFNGQEGFVPSGYLQEVPADQYHSNAGSPPAPQRSSAPSASPVRENVARTQPAQRDTSATPIAEKSFASVTVDQQQHSFASRGATDTKSSVRGHPHNDTTNLSASVVPSAAVPNPSAVVDAFLKNEVYFKQLMRQRQDALAKLESSLSEASHEVQQCRQRNSHLSKKLRDLDATVERERKKWRERVEEERQFLSHKASLPPGVAAAAQSVVAGTRSGSASHGGGAYQTPFQDFSPERDGPGPSAYQQKRFASPSSGGY